MPSSLPIFFNPKRGGGALSYNKGTCDRIEATKPSLCGIILPNKNILCWSVYPRKCALCGSVSKKAYYFVGLFIWESLFVQESISCCRTVYPRNPTYGGTVCSRKHIVLQDCLSKKAYRFVGLFVQVTLPIVGLFVRETLPFVGLFIQESIPFVGLFAQETLPFVGLFVKKKTTFCGTICLRNPTLCRTVCPRSIPFVGP